MDDKSTNSKPQTYTALDGTVYDLVGLTANERGFLDLVYDKYKHDSTWIAVSGLVTSAENPLLKVTKGRITRDVYEHPLFQAVRDLEDRAGIRDGALALEPGLNPDIDPFADDWLPVAEAAKKKGVSVQGLHKAIKRGGLITRLTKRGSKRRLVSVRSLTGWTPNVVRQKARKGRNGRRVATNIR